MSSGNRPDNEYDKKIEEKKESLLPNLIKKLPVKQQQIIKMYYFDGLNYLKISKKLKINRIKVGNTLTSARNNLRLMYKNLNHMD